MGPIQPLPTTMDGRHSYQRQATANSEWRWDIIQSATSALCPAHVPETPAVAFQEIQLTTVYKDIFSVPGTDYEHPSVIEPLPKPSILELFTCDNVPCV
jgi:hypothetical protein